MKRFLTCLILALLFSACAAERWEKPGATHEQFEQTKASCAKEATAKYPPMMRLQNRNESTITPDFPVCSTDARGIVRCQNVGGRQAPPVAAVDDNLADRNKAIHACLRQNGWYPAKE